MYAPALSACARHRREDLFAPIISWRGRLARAAGGRRRHLGYVMSQHQAVARVLAIRKAGVWRLAMTL